MAQHTTAATRGQVGIGTLIVFIAMILVAAITAGVLINTAGLLQSQADATAEDSSAQVSNNLQIFDATGQFETGTVDNPEILVGIGPGSDPIDLREITILAVGDNGNDRFTDGDVDRTAISGSDADVLTQRGDRVAIELSGLSLAAGEQTELIITTADGSQTTTRLRVPDTAQENSGIRL